MYMVVSAKLVVVACSSTARDTASHDLASIVVHSQEHSSRILVARSKIIRLCHVVRPCMHTVRAPVSLASTIKFAESVDVI